MNEDYQPVGRPVMIPPINSVSVDELAQEIRRIDGNNEKGAGDLAEGIMAFLAARRAANTPVSRIVTEDDGVSEKHSWSVSPVQEEKPVASEVRRHYHTQIGRLLKLVSQDRLDEAQRAEFDEIDDDHSWDGLSCACGGGWLVGHAGGCPEATRPASPVSAEVTASQPACEDCEGNVLVWFAPNALWNRVKGGVEATDDPGGVLCPNCFIKRAEAMGVVPTAWVIDTEKLDTGGKEPAALIDRAMNCDAWPRWLSDIVDLTNQAADAADMSTEQAVAHGILAALSTQGREAE
jgi:hypothetical protein